MTKEERAILDVISYAEGTLGISQNGYDVLFTKRTIVGWTENTDIVHGNSDWVITSGGHRSSAAGRYQFLGSKWISINGDKNLPMTKDNQDAAAIKNINNRLKSTVIDSRSVSISELTTRSKFDIFLQKCAPEWASLPLTKTITFKGDVKQAGRGFYSSQNSKKTADELYEVFMMAYSLY